MSNLEVIIEKAILKDLDDLGTTRFSEILPISYLKDKWMKK